MRIMTSNIWGDFFGNPVEERLEQMLTVYRKYAPDILGFQEITESWYRSGLFEALTDTYNTVGVEKTWDNYIPFLYNKSKFTKIANGHERFTDTTDVSKSVTWAVFESAEGRFAACNTHFWWMTGPEHDAIRVINGTQLASLMNMLHQRWNCPVFAFGDMNTDRDSGVFTVYDGFHIRHLWDMTENKEDISSHHGDPVRGEDGKYHGHTTDKPHRASLDHIVGLGNFTVEQYHLVLDKEALDGTDHSPVYADVTL